MIKAVMFDMGGTLEDLYSCERNDKAFAAKMMQILNDNGIFLPYTPDELWGIVKPQLIDRKSVV